MRIDNLSILLNADTLIDLDSFTTASIGFLPAFFWFVRLLSHKKKKNSCFALVNVKIATTKRHKKNKFRSKSTKTELETRL